MKSHRSLYSISGVIESHNGLKKPRLIKLATGDEAHCPVSTLTIFVRFAIKWHIDFHKAGIWWAGKHVYIVTRPLFMKASGDDLMERLRVLFIFFLILNNLPSGLTTTTTSMTFQRGTRTRLTKQDVIFPLAGATQANNSAAPRLLWGNYQKHR